MAYFLEESVDLQDAVEAKQLVKDLARATANRWIKVWFSVLRFDSQSLVRLWHGDYNIGFGDARTLMAAYDLSTPEELIMVLSAKVDLPLPEEIDLVVKRKPLSRKDFFEIGFTTSKPDTPTQ